METKTSALGKRHVLIVDDNVALAHFFEEILKLHGYDATVVSDGTLALKHALNQPTDVVVCDLQMPKLDGDLFYAAVERATPTLARRFIFITGMANDPRFEKFVNTVEAPVLRKPVAVEKLLDEIRRVLG